MRAGRGSGISRCNPRVPVSAVNFISVDTRALPWNALCLQLREFRARGELEAGVIRRVCLATVGAGNDGCIDIMPVNVT